MMYEAIFFFFYLMNQYLFLNSLKHYLQKSLYCNENNEKELYLVLSQCSALWWPLRQHCTWHHRKGLLWQQEYNRHDTAMVVTDAKFYKMKHYV